MIQTIERLDNQEQIYYPMDIESIQNTVEKVAEQYGAEVYDVYEENGRLKIKQETIGDQRFALLAALLFDQYTSGFDHIQIESPNQEGAITVRRSYVQDGLEKFAQIIGTTEDFKN